MPAIIQRAAAKFPDETYVAFSKGRTRSPRRTQHGSKHRIPASPILPMSLKIQ